MQIIKYKFIPLALSALLTVASVWAMWNFGYREGIDFSGGTLWQIKIEGVTKESLKDYLGNKLKLDEAIITEEAATQSFLVRLKETNEADHQKHLAALKKDFKGIQELRFETIGPAIGGELRSKAIWAFVLVLLGISLYIAFAFRQVSRQVSSWKYGLITLLTLFHDAIIAAGFYVWLGLTRGAELDTNFIIGVLVVIGFSVHDTIVVFDRIRENLRLQKGNEDFGSLVNRSINETMARSINTSLTLFLILIAMFFVGAEPLKNFVLLILVGTIIGTYSSIFVASPLLVLWKGKAK